MSLYLLLVILAIPGRPGTADLEHVVHREWIGASGMLACQREANKKADEQREKRAADVARLKARVIGVCQEVQPKEPT